MVWLISRTGTVAQGPKLRCIEALARRLVADCIRTLQRRERMAMAHFD